MWGMDEMTSSMTWERHTRPGLWAKLGRGVRTLVVAAFLVPMTLVCATWAILLAWVPLPGDAVVAIAWFWAWSVLKVSGVKVEVEGVERVDPERGYVVMANHASYFDVLALLAVLPGKYRFVAKKTLFQIPLFGWALKANGFIPVDRRDKSKAREIWAAAGERLARGDSVFFYPEGTRSPDGRIHTFHRGAFLVAMHTGAPILPVGVAGAWQVMPRDRFSIQSGTVRVRFGEPVETGDRSVREKKELIRDVRQEVARLSGAELA